MNEDNGSTSQQTPNETTAEPVTVAQPDTPTQGAPSITNSDGLPPAVNAPPAADSAPTEPATSVPAQPTVIAPKHGHFGLLLGALLTLALMVAAAGGGYLYAASKTTAKVNDQKRSDAAVAAASQELSIPQGATVIAQCAKGRGTQYVLPKDIPLGPVYNVYQGKVIGVEYMVGKDDLIGSAKSFLNLPLDHMKYDHVNIGLLSQGHAGFPTPHYHVDVMMVPTSVTDKITCT